MRSDALRRGLCLVVFSCVAGLLAVAVAAGPAAALTLDFNEFGHGDVVTTSQEVTITTVNFNDDPGHPDTGVAFSTLETNTEDPDLEYGNGWAGGNLVNVSPNELLDILIIQEKDTGCESGMGTCSIPDDEGRRAAGTFTLDFDPLDLDITYTLFNFDLIDVEDVAVENGSIEFLLDGGTVTSFDFDEFLGWGQGVAYGNRTANRIDFEARISGAYDQVVITMGGSGGVDNVVAAVPEPTTALLLAFGLVGLAAAGRRRSLQ